MERALIVPESPAKKTVKGVRHAMLLKSEASPLVACGTGPMMSGHSGDLTSPEISLAGRECSRPIDSEYDQADFNARLCLALFAELGVPLETDQTILDFGCGGGYMVYALRKLGFETFGTDIAAPTSQWQLLMAQEGLCKQGEEVLTTIDRVDYRIPFPDDCFDVVISWEVLDHVHDYDQALSELRRVIKPGGKSFHYFPARYRVLEPHISVPFATVIQDYRYLLFWAHLGVRSKSQRDLTPREVAKQNLEFLRSSTNYLKKKELTRIVSRYFRNVRFVEEHLWKHNCGKTGFIYRVLSGMGLARLVPIATGLISPFARRAIYFEKPRGESP
jgi:ubiquinone/menaquinone biosynthesis C-methylase UbiE